MNDAATLVALAAVGSAALWAATAISRRNRRVFTVRPEMLAGRTAIVTGASSGIGRQVAAELSAAGASTVMACRNVTTGEAVAASIRRRTRNDKVSVLALDLTSPASVYSFAEEFEKRHGRCDVLVLNAGVMCSSYRAEGGVEHTFFANYLGHWMLTQALLPSLKAAHEASGEKARVVSVASRLEKRAPPLLRNGALELAPFIMNEQGYSLGRAYAISKVCTAPDLFYHLPLKPLTSCTSHLLPLASYLLGRAYAISSV